MDSALNPTGNFFVLVCGRELKKSPESGCAVLLIFFVRNYVGHFLEELSFIYSLALTKVNLLHVDELALVLCRGAIFAAVQRV